MSNIPYRIVVGTDFSDTAALALNQAFDLAASHERGEVHVVNAVQYLGEFVQMDLPEAAAYRLPLEEAQERLEAHVGAKLSSWQEETKRTIARCATYVSIQSPAAAMAQLAADLEADLLVVGTHGRRGLQRFLLGSVAEAVVRLAPTAVYVVRPKGAEAKVPQIEPPCPRCVEARQASGGEQLWCEQHSEKHGRRHSYHYEDRRAQSGNMGSLLPSAPR
jgi:nucleotide-binding universal stress UspA family protein